MRFSPFNRALLRGVLAGAVVLTGTACSRPDRAESGSNNGSTVLPDSSNAPAQPSDTGAAAGAVSDTAAAPAESSTQPRTPAQPNTSRAETANPSESDAAGYRPMERDTAAVPGQRLDSARVTADSADAPSDSSVSGIPSTTDTAAVGYVEMARDTSTVAEQAETTASVAVVDSVDATTPDTNNAGRIRPTEDSTEILGQVRVRPPEDSTELLGSVTTTDEAADETADEQIINPADEETVAVSETTDEVGAAAVAADVTGAEAVALLSRQGVRCAVVDPEVNEAVRSDMSSTPVALNPCGMGSMNLSKIWTSKQ